MTENTVIHDLIFKYLTNKLTTEEEELLNRWKELDENRQFFDNLTNVGFIHNELVNYSIDDTICKDAEDQFVDKMIFVRRPSPPSKMRWLPIATIAATIVIVAIVYLSKIVAPVRSKINFEAADLSPADTTAILTISDGRSIKLDKNTQVPLALQSSFRVQKENNELVYTNTARPQPESTLFNVITTPKGSIYSVRLSDGSRIRLSAGSSLRYPTAFSKNNRIVFLRGEAFFDVVSADNSDGIKVPFTVSFSSANGQPASAKVLGTRFVVKTYSDDPVSTATVLAGKVMVESDDNNHDLLPGDVAHLFRSAHINIDRKSDTAGIWTNSYFRFKSTDIKDILRELSRWYNFDVRYEGVIPQLTFSGHLPRSNSLRRTLEILDFAGVNFRWDGKALHVFAPESSF